MQPSPPIEITVSRHFLAWLYDQHISLTFTTYQTNRLFLLGLKPDGSLSTFERLFDRPMGLHASSDRLYMSTRSQIWRFDNALPPSESHDGYDKLYVPRCSYTTGDLDAHDVVLGRDGEVIFVTTLFSCLASLSENYSFTPLWKPPFISKLVPEDRCHLNGVALEDGAPRYVTTVSRSDVAAGWRERRESGGCLVDVHNGEIVLGNLSMPHSPRLYRERLWLLNSGSGELGYFSPARGSFEPVAFCPGYLRGLAFHGDYAIVGLSKPRREKAFQGLPLDERLQEKDAEARCGLYIVDLLTGNIAHWLQIEGVVLELYDVGVLEGVQRPMALGFRTDEIERMLTFDDGTGLKFQALVGTSEAAASIRPPSMPGPRRARSKTPRPPSPESYNFQLSRDMTIAAVHREYSDLAFPDLRTESHHKPFHQPLTAVLARLGERPVGLVLAEHPPDNPAGVLRSLFVDPDHRRRGIALGLLANLETALIQQGSPHLDWPYRTNWPCLAIIEHILQTRGWQPPAVYLYLYRSGVEKLLKASALNEASLPADFTIFPWQELTTPERTSIQNRQVAENWYPTELDPFQEEGRRELVSSLGLRHRGQVVGWLVTYRDVPDTVQYANLFISPEFRSLGWSSLAVPLIAAALNRQALAGILYCTFQVPVQNSRLVEFIRIYLEEHLESAVEYRTARKLLR